MRLQSAESDEGIKKTVLAGEFATELQTELDSWMGRQSLADLDLEALENTARRAALHLAALLIQNHLNAHRTDGSDTDRACCCGQQARYVARRRTCVQSALGPLELERAYYHCPQCGAGFCPRDHNLGIEHSSVLPAVLRMMAAVGAMVSLKKAARC